MTDIYSGDILVTLDGDGADIIFPGNGEPIRDTGVENLVNFNQLTEAGHWTEDLRADVNHRYKGLTLEAIKKPITRQSLIDDARAAEEDGKDPVFRKIESEATNPVGQQVKITTKYYPISNDPFILIQEKNGENYINQIVDPAHKKI
jgi:NADPH-dependent curcumin reductase CurA